MTIRISIFNNGRVLGRDRTLHTGASVRVTRWIVLTKRCKTSPKWSRRTRAPRPCWKIRPIRETGAPKKWCTQGRQFLNNWLASGGKWITVWSPYNAGGLMLTLVEGNELCGVKIGGRIEMKIFYVVLWNFSNAQWKCDFADITTLFLILQLF